MTDTKISSVGDALQAGRLLPLLVAAAISLGAAAPGGAVGAHDTQEAATQEAEKPLSESATEAETEAAQAAAAAAAARAEQWGIEITSLRLTANDHMIDFRYRILDPDKATELFVRQNKPALIHQSTGKVLAVPETAKVGPLRNSNTPQAGKIYWMFFGNAGGLVRPGDEVTVVIGDFRAEDLVVE